MACGIASDYEPEGREFESLRAHHLFVENKQVKREPIFRLPWFLRHCAGSFSEPNLRPGWEQRLLLTLDNN
jgi:hypothetical protein